MMGGAHEASPLDYHISERAFQQQVQQYARMKGWLDYHPFDSRRSRAGFPDLTLVRDARLVFAELKKQRGRLSAAQKDWLARLEATPAETYVWRPSDWPEILEVLR